MTTYNVIPLSSDPLGQVTVTLGDVTVTLVTRYNYSAACWCMDIQDANGDDLLAGIMLVPGVDLLKAYQEEKKSLGSLILAEKTAGAYMDPDSLGTTTKLIWFAYGEEIAYP